MKQIAVAKSSDSDRLAEQAATIRKLGRQTLESVTEIGERLVKCRDILKAAGAWRAWLKSEFGWNEKTARNFINVYDLSKSECGTRSSSDLPLKSIYLLAAPSTSNEAREEVAHRVARGEKVTYRDVAAVTQKSKQQKQPTGLRAEIIAAVRAAGSHGMTTDELKVKFANEHHEQTVNSTTHSLAKADVFRDSGERRKTRAEGGRPAIVYIYNPAPEKRNKTPKIVDLNERRILGMIEDNSICKIIASWAEGKGEIERGKKAARLTHALIGKYRGNVEKFFRESRFGGAFCDEHSAMYDGPTITFPLKLK